METHCQIRLVEVLLGAIDTYQEVQKLQPHNVLTLFYAVFPNHSFCLLLLFINQTQGNVTTLQRPMGREIKSVVQIQICKVSELSLFQMKKLHKHKDFLFLYCIFFLFCHLFSKWRVRSLLDELW